MNAMATPHRKTSIALLTGMIGIGLLGGTLGGCKSQDSNAWKTATDLDEKYVVGPTLAGELGLRCLWQQEVPSNGSRIKDVADINGDILTVDTQNRVTLLRSNDGNQVWHSAPMPRKEQILGMDRIDSNGNNRLIITTDTDIFVLDGNTGEMVNRQNLPNAPITGVSRYKNELIFGGNEGRVVFHNAPVGYELRANSMRGQVSATPVVHDNEVVAVSNRGEVLLLNAGDASRIWSRVLTGGIDAKPAFNNYGIYVATLGQSIWCLDPRSGEVKWKYFTESPLKTGPTALGDRVFQFVPNEGLICFEAAPRDSPRGKSLWTNSAINGDVTTVIGNNLVLWDKDTKVITLVDADRGDTKLNLKLPKVKDLFAFRNDDNQLTIMVTSDDGRIQRLGSRNR